MKLTVLGNCGPFQRAKGTCSGYLVEQEGSKILLDCGNGVLSNLQRICKVEQLDAIILSHLHPDHISDIFVLRYALQFTNLSIPLYAPNDPQEEFQRLYHKSYDVHPIDENTSLHIGNIDINFKRMEHVLPNFAISMTWENTKFVYSGDTAYTEKLIEFSKDANLLLCEAGVLEKDLPKTPPHLSAKQAVDIINQAKVKKGILTHFYPEYTLEMYQKEVQEQSDIAVEYAQEMKEYFI